MKCILPLLMLCSCSLQSEKMTRMDGSTYSYLVGQIGSQTAAESSSGSRYASNSETSFKDFMQGIGVAVAGWSQVAIGKAKEVTAQYQSGQITKQELQASLERIRLAEIAAETTETTVLNPNIIPQ